MSAPKELKVDKKSLAVRVKGGLLVKVSGRALFVRESGFRRPLQTDRTAGFHIPQARPEGVDLA
jgi:hypothetical protein